MRSPTPGPELFVNAQVKDRDGKPVADAEVDIWQSSTEGLYENQDPTQADMNLRGKFTTDAKGEFSFRSILPAGYPIPINGPVGDLLRAQGRHNMRPAHLHFLIFKEGCKTHISQVYRAGGSATSRPTCSSASPRRCSATTCATRTSTPPAPGVKDAVVHARLHVRHGAGKAELPRAPIQDKAKTTEMRPQYLPANRAPAMAK